MTGEPRPAPALARAYAAAARRVAALQAAPRAFGPGVSTVECVETHISWVLLAGEFAYKFKKPLALDFLDFSSQALRRSACEEELRINRRTAPGLYLGLVGVCDGAEEGALCLKPLDQAPPDAEPAVQMRRFAAQDLFSTAVQEGRVAPCHLDALARHVAQFHASAPVAAASSGWGEARAVQAPVQACIQALRALLPAVAPGLLDTLAQVAQGCEREGAAHAPVFEERRADGHVRECHADMHLANIAFIDGQPQLFDAIEFSAALRWIDCAADLAFLLMDLVAHDRPALAWRALNGWLEHTGDYGTLRVLGYYCAYRALVRARVVAMQLSECEGAAVEAGGRVKPAQALQRYLGLAAAFSGAGCGAMLRGACAVQRHPPAVWLTHGFSGAGKSTHSLALACERGLVRVRADVERKRLFGVPPTDSSAHVPGGIYTPEATERTLQRLEQVVRDALGAGFAVVVDATFQRADQRERFRNVAAAAGVPCTILSFDAPLPVLRDRVRARSLRGGDASEADGAVLEAQLRTAEPLSPQEEAMTLHVDTTRPVDWSVLLPACS